VIRREILVQEQAPLREGEVVDSQRRLYNLGVFNRVTITTKSNGRTQTRMCVLVEEAKRYTLAYGGGSKCSVGQLDQSGGKQVQAAIRGFWRSAN